MNVIIIGSGMMGRTIAYDLSIFSNFKNISIADRSKENIKSAKIFLNNTDINFLKIDVKNKKALHNVLKNYDLMISAIPYDYNFYLSKVTIDAGTHLIDLGGNNVIVEKQKSLFEEARERDVTILPDCGLAPGLVSIITKEIVEIMDAVEYVKIRVGGVPINPKPPLKYQIVFSPNGLINEYIQEALILQNGEIVRKKPMTEIEDITFPKPFGKMEAFITSGGSSTLPYSYKDKIDYLDYKTIRYPGHCKYITPVLEMGFGGEEPVVIGNQKIVPRKLLIKLIMDIIPATGEDVVLLRIMAKGKKKNDLISLEYNMVDYSDKINKITAMMRTTAYPVSITAQMIEKDIIKERGVFFPEEIIPCVNFFKELEKRDIILEKSIKKLN